MNFIADPIGFIAQLFDISGHNTGSSTGSASHHH